MRLSEWRKSKSISTSELARQLGLNGERDSGNVWNWETGRARPDADIVEAIDRLTEGAVSAADMHAVRLDWLKANRPEKFSAAPTMEAAQ